ncbi:MAG: NAD(P)H-binding protein [Candidatus Thermoplasmatota archaeon]
MRVFVTGGTGYVGPAVLQALLGAGHDVTVLEHAHPCLIQHPHLSRVKADLADAAALREAMGVTEAVIHLVAIRRGSRTDFERTAQGCRNVVAAAREAGARRFLLMSANGVDEGTTPYFGAKREMERAVKDSGLEWTILRPSYVAGDAPGSFDDEFSRVVDKAPVLPSFMGGKFEIQPISRHDVALAFANALDDPRTHGKTYVLVGPERFTWNEYLRKLARLRGKKRLLAYVPRWFILLVSSVLGRAFPASPDELRMLMQGSVGEVEPARSDLKLPLMKWDDAVAGLRRG